MFHVDIGWVTPGMLLVYIYIYIYIYIYYFFFFFFFFSCHYRLALEMVAMCSYISLQPENEQK